MKIFWVCFACIFGMGLNKNFLGPKMVKGQGVGEALPVPLQLPSLESLKKLLESLNRKVRDLNDNY